MRFLYFILLSLFTITTSNSQCFQGIVFEELDNGDMVFGTTYRMYAQVNQDCSLYRLFADETNPHLIETTTTFYQDSFGDDFQSSILPLFFPFAPTLEWDSWVTLGDSYDDAPSTVGDLNLSSFNGSSWSFGGTINSDASIFRIIVTQILFLMKMDVFYWVNLQQTEIYPDTLI